MNLKNILYIKRIYKQLVALSNDVLIAVFALWASFCIKDENFHFINEFEMPIYILIFIFIPIFFFLEYMRHCTHMQVYHLYVKLF